MQSQSKLEVSIALSLILFGVLIACSSNELLLTACGLSLMLLGSALYRG